MQGIALIDVYSAIGITGVSTLSSKGPGEYVFNTVVGLQPCLALPSKYPPQPSSPPPHWSLLHSCCSQLTPLTLCSLTANFQFIFKNLHTCMVLFWGPLNRILLPLVLTCRFMLLICIFAMDCNTLERGTK